MALHSTFAWMMPTKFSQIAPAYQWFQAIFLSAFGAAPDQPDHFNRSRRPKEIDRDGGAASNRNQIQSGQGESESPSE
jgi:hypothetical protein